MPVSVLELISGLTFVRMPLRLGNYERQPASHRRCREKRLLAQENSERGISYASLAEIQAALLGCTASLRQTPQQAQNARATRDECGQAEGHQSHFNLQVEPNYPVLHLSCSGFNAV